jgi:Protein of unknown function (DUF3800)
MLSCADLPWCIAMFDFEVYFDDSGTDGTNEIAVAACYVSSRDQWDHFNRNWKEILDDEHFDHFHMAHFAAKSDAGHKPFCTWDDDKKKRVYRRLASTINIRVRHGFAIAVPKKSFDTYAPQEFKEQYAGNHYVWAVKSVFGLLEEWRKNYRIVSPMQYVFDRGSLGNSQIQEIWDQSSRDGIGEAKYGLFENDGVLFQDKKIFRPLQAADILAWQMHNHMRKVIAPGCEPHAEFARSHPGFRLLRDHQSLKLGFYSAQQVENVFAKTRDHHRMTGRWPWKQGGPIAATVRLTEPGKV